MDVQVKRGSEKLLAAWKSRALTEESIKEIAGALDKSPAKVEGAYVSGGSNATGLQLSLRYDGDDTPYCGNDLQFILRWVHKHNIGINPHILINGVWPDLVRMELRIGAAGEGLHEIAELPAAGGFRE